MYSVLSDRRTKKVIILYQTISPGKIRSPSLINLPNRFRMFLLLFKESPTKMFKVYLHMDRGVVPEGQCSDGVRQIKVNRNVDIASVRVCFDLKGEAVWGSKNGGTGSFKKNLIVFDYPSEILTHITGYHGPTMVMGPNVINSLTFHTTKAKYGPYGEEQGNPFSTNVNEGKIVGSHGKKGLFLDAIGVHVMEVKVVAPKISSPAKVAPPVSSPTKVVVPAVSASTKSSTKSSNKPEAKMVPPMNSATKVVPPVASPIKPPNQPNELVIKEVDTPKWSFMPGKRGVSQDQALQRHQ